MVGIGCGFNRPEQPQILELCEGQVTHQIPAVRLYSRSARSSAAATRAELPIYGSKRFQIDHFHYDRFIVTTLLMLPTSA